MYGAREGCPRGRRAYHRKHEGGQDSVENGRAVGVETAAGVVHAEIVVNCAGIWARELGRTVGVDVPLRACEHFSAVTDPMEGMHPDLPVMRDMDHCAYYKEDAGKLQLGAFERRAKPWAL